MHKRTRGACKHDIHESYYNEINERFAHYIWQVRICHEMKYRSNLDHVKDNGINHVNINRYNAIKKMIAIIFIFL